MRRSPDRNPRALHWDRIHQKTDPQRTSWFQPRPTLSLELIEGAHLDSTAPILDVGGGTSHLVDCLLEAGYRHLGVLDVSGRALERVRRRLGPRSRFVEWIEADVTEFTTAHRWDLWHDRAVFHFLTDPLDRQTYRSRLLDALTPGGCVVLGTFGPDGPTHCSGLECRRYDLEGLSRFLGPEFELEEHLLDDHRTPAGPVQQFLYARFRLGG